MSARAVFVLLPRAIAALIAGLSAGILGHAYAAGTIVAQPAPPAWPWTWALMVVGLLLIIVILAAGVLVEIQEERSKRRRTAEMRAHGWDSEEDRG